MTAAPSTTSFRVVARAGQGSFGGTATLDVTAEGLTLRPGFLLSRASGLAAIVHRAREVRVLRPRLPLPWTYATIVVDSGPATAVASVGPRAWHRLRTVLEAQGYSPQVEAIWTGRGDGLVRGGRPPMPGEGRT